MISVGGDRGADVMDYGMSPCYRSRLAMVRSSTRGLHSVTQSVRVITWETLSRGEDQKSEWFKIFQTVSHRGQLFFVDVHVHMHEACICAAGRWRHRLGL